jgi:hypothetical protein
VGGAEGPGAGAFLILNNEVVFDNRIPPRGYEFERFKAAGAAPYAEGKPDRDRYADGQNWDTTIYELPPGVVSGSVRLLHQVASGEYIEFLQVNNPNPAPNNGGILYDLWLENNRSRPEVMAEKSFGLETHQSYLPVVADGN